MSDASTSRATDYPNWEAHPTVMRMVLRDIRSTLAAYASGGLDAGEALLEIAESVDYPIIRGES